MAWVRLDDRFPHNPKVLKAGPLGLAMQVAAICYCNQHLTDGFLPSQAASHLLDFSGLAMRCWDNGIVGGGVDADWRVVVQDLVEARLWVECEGGWRIHDYLEYQPSKSQVLQARSQNANRQAKWRNAVSNTVSNTVSNGPVTPAPSKNPSKNKKDIEGARKRARTTIPPDWLLSETGRQYALSKSWSAEQTDREAEAFRDRNLKTGTLYADWEAAWRTWVQNAPKFAGNQRPALSPADPHATERAALEAWLKPSRVPTGVWLGHGPPPNDPNNTLPAALKAEYAERIAARSAEIDADKQKRPVQLVSSNGGTGGTKGGQQRSVDVPCSSALCSIEGVG